MLVLRATGTAIHVSRLSHLQTALRLMPKRRANSLDIDAKLMVGITDSVRCSFTFWILQGTGLPVGWDGKSVNHVFALLPMRPVYTGQAGCRRQTVQQQNPVTTPLGEPSDVVYEAGKRPRRFAAAAQALRYSRVHRFPQQ